MKRRDDGEAEFPLNSPHSFFYASGRIAMVASIRLIQQVREGLLLLPSYICRSVTDSLDQDDCDYRYYPVTRRAEPDYEALVQLVGGREGKVSSLLFVNYFGFPQPISRLARICGEHGIFVLEDNAHGFLGRDGEGCFLGLRGDIGIFSFPKTVYLPNGGAMVINNPALRDNCGGLGIQKTSKGIPGSYLLKRQILKTIGALGIDQKVVGRLRHKEGSSAVPSIEMNAGISSVAKYLLEHVRRDTVVSFRRRGYREVVRICREEGLKPLFEDLTDGICPYLVPVVAPRGEKRERATRALRNKGWKVSHWPDLPHDLEERNGDCAEWLREEIMAVYLRPAVV